MAIIIKKEFLRIITQLLRWKLVMFYALLIALLFSGWHWLPDPFHVSELPAKKDIEFRLLTAVIGFAGLLLTVLLVAYNFYIKSIRRNTLDYITDNPWFRLVFTFFFCNVLFLALGFLVMGMTGCNDVTLLYISFLSAIGFILSLFPLAILSLNDAGSLRRIDLLVNKISETDLEALIQPEFDADSSGRIRVEHNPVMLLRDMAVGAVTDKDWVVPQTILRRLYERLILPIESSVSDDALFRTINAWVSICNPIKREIIKQEDEPSATALFYLNVSVHRHLAAKKLTNIRELPLDNFFKDYISRIFKKDLFTNVQDYIPRYLVEIVQHHFMAFKFPDNEVPTMTYISQHREEFATQRELTPLRMHWFYLTKELPDLIFSAMHMAADTHRIDAFRLLTGNFHQLTETIVKCDNLTQDQKNEAIRELLFWAGSASDYAIANGIFERVDIIATPYVPGWFKIDRNIGYAGFYTYSGMIRKLYNHGGLSSHYVDEYFMLVRDCFISGIDPEIMYELVKTVLDNSFRILDKQETSIQTRKDFLYEMQWLKNEYLTKYESAKKIYAEYGDRIEKYLSTYDGRNEYFEGYF